MASSGLVGSEVAPQKPCIEEHGWSALESLAVVFQDVTALSCSLPPFLLHVSAQRQNRQKETHIGVSAASFPCISGIRTTLATLS